MEFLEVEEEEIPKSFEVFIFSHIPRVSLIFIPVFESTSRLVDRAIDLERLKGRFKLIPLEGLERLKGTLEPLQRFGSSSKTVHFV